MRSWELVARYVVPELNGYTANLRGSQQYLHDNQAELMGGASRAVMSKIMAHEGAAKAMATTMEQMAAQQATPSRTTPRSAPAPASRPATEPRSAQRSARQAGPADGGEGDAPRRGRR